MPKIRLGLIGDNIEQSKSPLLHRLAGRLCRLDVEYAPLIPARIGVTFDALFDRCQREGYAGVNITYPYKERVVARLVALEPDIRAIGAVNTVRFDPAGGVGFNTDYTGFIAAFRESLAAVAPGRVALIGAGGVGKAIAFALLELGAVEIRLYDRELGKAEQLGEVLRHAARNTRIGSAESVAQAVAEADGLINATPIGMAGLPGSPVAAADFRGRAWAFDAVYTPSETEFLCAARAAGVAVMSGYELFFHQGLHAFTAFTGHRPDPAALRAELRRLEQEERRLA